LGVIEKLTFFALRVPQMDEAVKFYTDVLGLQVDEKETVPGNYTQFKLDSVAGLALIHGLDQEGDMQSDYDLALRVKDVDQFYAHLVERGVEVGSAPRDIPWGRTCLFRTPDGHVLRAFSTKTS
jgi:predicted enzyme related to lactoylglutathione lyase